ncbi:MAG TPA: hypothetical protein VJP77_00830, partial [Planctomycetota bacterium]|nr:hypothetical protein [Planctomycetota bacterium]
AAPAPAQATGQESVEARLARLEAANEELRRQLGLLSDEVESTQLGDVAPRAVRSSQFGLAPAASKVYGTDSGVSLGGYGEMLYQNKQGSGTDELDFLRAVLYAGYRFDEHWVFNSEIEFEHATVEDTDTDGTDPDTAPGSVSVEFAYLDYLHTDALNARVGLLLVPMGLLNELHEPTTFLSADRPETEKRILPSTWRENGAGVHGTLGESFDYRAYVVNGFDASGFSAAGLRGGRQKGGKALAEDFAGVARVDYVGTPGLLAGGSVYYGQADQEQGAEDVDVAIAELHADARFGGFRLRALAAVAELDGVEALNAAQGIAPGSNASIGESQLGWYAEAGYDVLQLVSPTSKQSLVPFVRYESLDTQDEVPDGFVSNPANDLDLVTYGVAWQPMERVIFKADYVDADNGSGTATDLLRLSVGYVF